MKWFFCLFSYLEAVSKVAIIFSFRERKVVNYDMNKRSRRTKFKEYNPGQMSLLPPSLEELIPADHVVRIVDHVIDRIKLDPLVKKYPGGGASSYHPRMMLKILVYAYLCNTYQSRKIEAAVQSDIHYMWLAGMQRPDHNTINRFRSERLKGVLKEVFSQVVELLAEQGVLDIKKMYVDGTKLEANANRYTFVWGNSIKYNKERIQKQIKELLEYAEEVTKEDLMDSAPGEITQINADKVSQIIDQINTSLEGKEVDKKIKNKLKRVKKSWPKNLEKYKKQEDILGDRKSYSKTDPDATFMRTKDDHFKNGQLKPCYNWQISTSDQYITNYGIYANPTDTLTLPSHLNEFKDMYGFSPEVVVADAGYGSDENYSYMEEQNIEAYVKYNFFHKEHKAKIKPKEVFQAQYLYYDEDEDYMICPMGQKMVRIDERQVETKSGHIKKIGVYEAQNCEGCPLRGVCNKQEGNRKINLNYRYRKLKNRARERLLSKQGVQYRSQRCVDVEPVFGNIKQNKNFTRFLTRGKENVLIEVGLLSIAHNLGKFAKN